VNISSVHYVTFSECANDDKENAAVSINYWQTRMCVFMYGGGGGTVQESTLCVKLKNLPTNEDSGGKINTHFHYINNLFHICIILDYN
jgi:hypothetical protein